jgi:hypothetical protein
MNLHNATNKKTVYNWNKIFQLNKLIVARVENNNIPIQLSLINIGDNQDKLLEYFNENKIFENFIKSFCLLNEYDLNDFWNNIIHKIDTKRRELNENLSYWTFFINNINNLETWINDNKINQLINFYNKKRNIIILKNISKIGIISGNGITALINFLKDTLLNIKCKYTLKYKSAPYYILETEDITKEEHNNILINIINESILKNIFIKIYD